MSQRTRSAGGAFARYICDWRAAISAALVGHASEGLATFPETACLRARLINLVLKQRPLRSRDREGAVPFLIQPNIASTSSACPRRAQSAASFARMDKLKHVLRQNPDGVVQSAVGQSQCRESCQDPDCPFVSRIHFGAIAWQILQ
jgi:hypothetical protein